jgi:hypothetical protein
MISRLTGNWPVAVLPTVQIVAVRATARLLVALNSPTAWVWVNGHDAIYLNLAFGTLARMISRNLIRSSFELKHRFGTIINDVLVTSNQNAVDTSSASRKAVQFNSWVPVEASILTPSLVIWSLAPFLPRGSRRTFRVVSQHVIGVMKTKTNNTKNHGVIPSANLAHLSSGVSCNLT